MFNWKSYDVKPQPDCWSIHTFNAHMLTFLSSNSLNVDVSWIQCDSSNCARNTLSRLNWHYYLCSFFSSFSTKGYQQLCTGLGGSLTDISDLYLDAIIQYCISLMWITFKVRNIDYNLQPVRSALQLIKRLASYQ